MKIIISAHRDDVPAPVNADNDIRLDFILRRRYGAANVQFVRGMYDGVQEDAYIVDLQESGSMEQWRERTFLEHLAFTYRQDSILRIGPNNIAHLIYTHASDLVARAQGSPGSIKYLGRFVRVEETEACEHNAWTCILNTDAWYICKHCEGDSDAE